MRRPAATVDLTVTHGQGGALSVAAAAPAATAVTGASWIDIGLTGRERLGKDREY